jgi:hypothetical protein
MDIRYCARLLTRLGLSRCPVLDNGEIVGVVSLTNIVLNGLHLGGGGHAQHNPSMATPDCNSFINMYPTQNKIK